MSDESIAMETIRQVFSLAGQGKLGYNDLKSVTSVIEMAENYSLAALLYREWLAYTPSPCVANVHCDLADALIQIGEPAEAHQAFEQALAAFPGYLRATIGLESCRQP